MKKSVVLASLVLGVSALSGCINYGNNYAKEYDDFLSYSFGKDYKIEQVEKDIEKSEYLDDYEFAYTKWLVSYTDKNGKSREAELVSEEYEDNYDNQMDKSKIAYFVREQQANICLDELNEKIISKYFDYKVEKDWIMTTNDDYTLMVMPSFYASIPAVLYNDFSEIEQMISPTSGIKVCESTAETFLKDKTMGLYIAVITDKKDKLDDYYKKLDAMAKEIDEYVGGTTNTQYCLKYKQGITNDSKNVYVRTTIDGKLGLNGKDFNKGVNVLSLTEFLDAIVDINR